MQHGSGDGVPGRVSRARVRGQLNTLTYVMQGSLSQALSDRIPMEVFEEVIDRMDNPMLCRAAVVCTTWHPRATYNLYLSIELRTRKSFDLLVKQSLHSARVKRLLATTHKLVASDKEIANLRLQGNTRPNTRFVHALPLVFGRAMPQLRALEIRGDLPPSAHPTFKKFFLALSQFRALTSLSLRNFRLNNFAQLRWIVGAFASLEELTLSNGSLHLLQDADAIDSRPSVALQSDLRLLRLDVDMKNGMQTFETVVDWFVSSAICRSLRDLKVWWPNDHSVEVTTEAIDRLLKAAGPSLTQFCEVTHYAVGKWPRISVHTIQRPTSCVHP
ncbi:uncharacterized protein B0H18DRAFT_68012 [Fomitopsis serialis]|uniref:uncharacterized protein n=1 Tax=Fomitopsis serialis TaxID=139415 RepID=UPI00200744DA|nr:uncharacterized protein B0H18DRAFT_68012 [Neoantrodia serialis]KAH9931817.1 hypothetical protein B0H18DRAFT_68012 [Neoantrodia serialis]